MTSVDCLTPGVAQDEAMDGSLAIHCGRDGASASDQFACVAGLIEFPSAASIGLATWHSW